MEPFKVGDKVKINFRSFDIGPGFDIDTKPRFFSSFAKEQLQTIQGQVGVIKRVSTGYSSSCVVELRHPERSQYYFDHSDLDIYSGSYFYSFPILDFY